MARIRELLLLNKLVLTDGFGRTIEVYVRNLGSRHERSTARLFR
jgi:hypothetical protein